MGSLSGDWQTDLELRSYIFSSGFLQPQPYSNVLQKQSNALVSMTVACAFLRGVSMKIRKLKRKGKWMRGKGGTLTKANGKEIGSPQESHRKQYGAAFRKSWTTYSVRDILVTGMGLSVNPGLNIRGFHWGTDDELQWVVIHFTEASHHKGEAIKQKCCNQSDLASTKVTLSLLNRTELHFLKKL